MTGIGTGLKQLNRTGPAGLPVLPVYRSLPMKKIFFKRMINTYLEHFTSLYLIKYELFNIFIFILFLTHNILLMVYLTL